MFGLENFILFFFNQCVVKPTNSIATTNANVTQNATNVTNLTSTVSTNTAAITSNDGDITTANNNIASNASSITTLTGLFSDQQTSRASSGITGLPEITAISFLSQIGSDIDSEASCNVSLSAAGDVVAIGAPLHNNGGIGTADGHVRIYRNIL